MKPPHLDAAYEMRSTAGSPNGSRGLPAAGRAEFLDAYGTVTAALLLRARVLCS